MEDLGEGEEQDVAQKHANAARMPRSHVRKRKKEDNCGRMHVTRIVLSL